ncbi:MAG: DUF4402 domain-containing protein [Anaeroplasmataceae bacterium]
MKKLLLTGLFIIGAMNAFASAPGHEAEMKITAEVMETLKIERKTDVDFGRIAQGASYSANGEYEITGQKGASVSVDIDTANVFMVRAGGNTDKATDRIAVAFDRNKNESVNLDANGKYSYPIKASINVSSDQITGIYEGSILAKVRYN